ncbi:MAG: hypothetical protein H7Y17_15085 [Chlorobia bacterium]|nr:hypothetical protein [Fimbriimonadaceae bacterium]
MKTIALAIGLVMAAGSQLSPEHKRIEKLLQTPPNSTEIIIEHRPIANLERVKSWHIGDSKWWIRLQPADIYRMRELDVKRKYKVTGVVLEQNYGAIEFWVKRLEYAD